MPPDHSTDAVARDHAPRRVKYEPAGTIDQFIVPLLRERIEAALRSELSSASRVVLDAGCGRQPFRHLMESHGTLYVGMDVTQTPEGSVDVLAAIDAPIPPSLQAFGPFDFILCTEVLEHVADWPTAFTNIASLLKPTGRVLLTCPHFYPLHEEPFDFWRPTRHALAYHANRVGLRVIRIETAGDCWDILGTLLAGCTAQAHVRTIPARVVAKAVDFVRRLTFSLLRRRWPQRLARLEGAVYLCNIAVLEKP